MSDRTANGRQELRCFCSRSSLLAVYGIDRNGKPFLHYKVWKQRRVYGEFVFNSGTVRIFCPNCIRWHVITIRENSRPQLVETQKPVELEAGVTRDADV